MTNDIDKLYELRKKRKANPDGVFDKQGRWYPSEAERCPCCDTVKPPSRNNKFSLLVHCRGKRHIEELAKKGAVMVSEVNDMARKIVDMVNSKSN
jgi:hypothetical protein